MTYTRYDGAKLTTSNAAAGAAWAAQSPTPAPAGAAPAGAQSSGIRPSASEVSRITAFETQTAQYIIQQSNVIEECFAHVNCHAALIYCLASVSNGVLTGPADTVYIGRTRAHLTEERADTTPVLINESSSGAPQSCRTYVNGPAGTIIPLQYR